MQHLVHRTVVAEAQLILQLQLLHVDAERRPVTELDARRMQHGFPIKVEPARRVHNLAKVGERRLHRLCRPRTRQLAEVQLRPPTRRKTRLLCPRTCATRTQVNTHVAQTQWGTSWARRTRLRGTRHRRAIKKRRIKLLTRVQHLAVHGGGSRCIRRSPCILRKPGTRRTASSLACSPGGSFVLASCRVRSLALAAPRVPGTLFPGVRVVAAPGTEVSPVP